MQAGLLIAGATTTLVALIRDTPRSAPARSWWRTPSSARWSEGCAAFDFLRGAEEYKYRWGAVDQPMFALRLWHSP